METLTTPVQNAPATKTIWNLDASHSKIGFSVRHMMLSEAHGFFRTFEGSVASTNDDFTDTKITLSVNIDSINTEDEKRDGHLKSPDFFDAANFPKMTFVSTSFNKVKGTHYKLTGDLTIKGVTKKVEFETEYLGTVKNPFSQAVTAGFKINGEINRVDFGLQWNFALETGGLLVGEKVKISCEVELIKQ